MKIEHINNEKKGSFIAFENGIEIGELTYVWAGPSKFIIDSSNVNPDFRGKNVGNQLVMEAVAFARHQNVKIIPLCPFANNIFDRTDSIRDVLDD